MKRALLIALVEFGRKMGSCTHSIGFGLIPYSIILIVNAFLSWVDINQFYDCL